MAKNERSIPDDLAPNEFRCFLVNIPDDVQYIAHFLGALEKLALVSGYEGELNEKRAIAALWRTYLADISNAIYSGCNGTERNTGALDNLITNFQQQLGCDCEESEDEEMALQIQNIGGVDYLVENCCGGATKYYQLAAANLTSEGTPIAGELGGSFGGAFDGGSTWDGVVTENNASCYAQEATAYLLNAAEEFAHVVIDAATLGIDYVSGNVDEVIDAISLIAALAFNTLTASEIQSLTKAQVTTALTDSTLIATMEAAWNYTGSVNKLQLWDWAKSAPIIGNAVPVQFIINQMIGFSLPNGLNSQLELLAASCESGATVDESGTIIVVNPDLDIYVFDWLPGEKQLLVQPSGFDITTLDNIVMVATHMSSTVSQGVQTFQSYVNGNQWMEYDADVGDPEWYDFRGVATYFSAFKAAMPAYSGVVGAQPGFAPDSGLVEIRTTTNTGDSQIIDLLQVAIMVDKSL